MTFNRVLVLGLSWSLLWVGCAPLTSTDLHTVLDQSKARQDRRVNTVMRSGLKIDSGQDMFLV